MDGVKGELMGAAFMDLFTSLAFRKNIYSRWVLFQLTLSITEFKSFYTVLNVVWYVSYVLLQ